MPAGVSLASHKEAEKTLGYAVAIAVAIAVLIYLWRRGRRARGSRSFPEVLDRGLGGEAATAFEDIALEIIGPENGRAGTTGDDCLPDQWRR